MHKSDLSFCNSVCVTHYRIPQVLYKDSRRTLHLFEMILVHFFFFVILQSK